MPYCSSYLLLTASGYSLIDKLHVIFPSIYSANEDLRTG